MMTTLEERQPRIALLIDADNAPAELIDEILTELSTLGVINIRRAYGNWTKAGLGGWQSKLLEFALRPMQQFDYSKRKNATDMAMTVDAMELLYTERPDAYGIVSSDADFTPLVMHLRAKGAAVYGFGAQQTPKPFVNACSRFLYLEALGSAAPAAGLDGEGMSGTSATGASVVPAGAAQGGVPTLPAAASAAAVAGDAARNGSPAAAPVAGGQPQGNASGHGSGNGNGNGSNGNGNANGSGSGNGLPIATTLRVPTAQLRQNTALLSLLRDAVHATQDESGWARVGAVGTQIANKASFDARNFGYATLTKLLAATQAFELRGEGTSQVAVRDKRTGPSKT